MREVEAGHRALQTIDALPMADRADRLLAHLQQIAKAAREDLAGGYTVEALAIEGWLRTAIATAEQLAAELRGDAPDPGGEHGGPAD